jgi:hypothetical protein
MNWTFSTMRPAYRTWKTAAVAAVLVAFACVPPSAVATPITGTIDTVHINTQTNRAHVSLVGQPAFDGGGCSSQWPGNDMDDDKFMIYVWPALMSAKSKGFPVVIHVSGCVGGYPKIVWVDVKS